MSHQVPLKDWTGNADPAVKILDGVHPPALMDDLQIAAWYPIAVATTYSGCARMFVGNDATGAGGMAMDTRRFWTVTGVGVVQGRMYVTTCGDGVDTGGAQQSDIEIGGTTGGGIPLSGGGNDIVTTPNQSYGTAAYMDVGATSTQVLVYQTGQTIDNAPTAPIDRMLELNEALAPNLEQFEIANVAGCSIGVAVYSKDLDDL